MNLLLDTHALIWFLEDDVKLARHARTAISDPENKAFVSDATAWEIGIKHSLGKLDLPVPYESLFPYQLEALGFHRLPIRYTHLHRQMQLPWHHRDPFDRLLIAQAQVEGMALISRDQHFSAYDIPLIWD